MAALAVLATVLYPSFAGGATTQRTLENWPAIQTLVRSLVLTKQGFATPRRYTRSLADGDACTTGAPLSIEDKTFDSTGCYIDTPIDGRGSGFLYTETGVEPVEDGTGWNQGVIFAVSVLPSTLQSSSSSENDTTTNAVTHFGASSIGRPTGTDSYSSFSSTSSSSSSISGCEESGWKSDGVCDPGNNNAECEFDGGDCCECTCVETPEYICGYFNCIDPGAPCVNDDDGSTTSSSSFGCEESGWKSDGVCDPGNNNAECEFDGGDCCECTCVDTPEYICGYFTCIDPGAPCVNDDDGSTTSSSSSGCEESGWKSDGVCDPGNNNAECAFDGGDCCECTCVDTPEYICGYFTCIDPGAPCVNDDDGSTTSSSSSGCEESGWKSDGVCDPGNNNAECEFDGGDCCECTCVDTPEYICGYFNCIDPSAPCVNDDDDESASSSPSLSSSSHSLPSSTPSSSSSYSSSTYGEIDDTSGNTSVNVTMPDGLLSFNFSSSTTEMFWISTYIPPFNGQPLELASMEYVCRSSIVEVGSHPTNTAVWSCAFLEESSGGSSAVFEEMPASLFSTQCGCNNTGSSSTSTNDSASGETPTSSSPSPLSSSSSSSGCENSAWKTNGVCDPGNNNAECAFDGGDCCACTCVDTPEYTCDDFIFDCIDPSAPCVNDDDGSTSSSSSSGCEDSGWKSDGECDPGNNNGECEFDGGDCCECTCVDTPQFTCDDFIFYCIDPSAPCENVDESSGTSDDSDTRPTKDDTSPVESAGKSADRETTIDGLVLFIYVLGSAGASAVWAQ